MYLCKEGNCFSKGAQFPFVRTGQPDLSVHKWNVLILRRSFILVLQISLKQHVPDCFRVIILLHHPFKNDAFDLQTGWSCWPILANGKCSYILLVSLSEVVNGKYKNRVQKKKVIITMQLFNCHLFSHFGLIT